MATIIASSARDVEPLIDGWECATTEPNAVQSPTDLHLTDWVPAEVPGTAASALREAGRWNGEEPLELDGRDVWYRVRFAGGCDETLRFEGLATIADVWFNGRHLLRSENMFVSREAAVRTDATNEVHICFRSLSAWLAGKRGHAHWRTRLALPSTLRFARTTLLGRMPGWCPSVHPVGPWRPVTRRRQLARFSVAAVDARVVVSGDSGSVELKVALDGEPAPGLVACVDVGPASARLDRTATHEFAGRINIPGIARWWPHTHGTPHLYNATLRIDDLTCDLGRIGFREIAVDRGHDGRGFTVRVNGERIFCRGACWTTPDIVTLPGTAEAYRPWLEAMRDAGANMIRVGGTMLYEADDFYAVCDELGLLVWQDAMLANFDYPATDEFRASLAAELTELFGRTQTRACMAVFCGGSEVLQQATMLGLTSDRIDDSLYTEFLPNLVGSLRPDLPYVVNSPSGGALPFQTDTGVAHYYGLGAYLRLPDDVRRSAVRFASECLALANVPDARTVHELGIVAAEDPRWKHAVPRDRGASWDFEDVRDHYLQTLFNIDPHAVRETDFAHYLDLSRAVSCTLIELAFAEWRRGGSSCSGALIWQLQDVKQGAGWGLIDAKGRRKAAWFAMWRASRPWQLVITDEGLNGLDLHVLNERDRSLRGTLRLSCLRDGTMTVRTCEQAVEVAPRGAVRLNSADLLPGFFDITYAYHFGPPAHDVTVAALYDADGKLIADAFHFPAPSLLPIRDLGLEIALEQSAGVWWLCLRARCFAQFVHIEDVAFTPDENWFHLPPDSERRIALRPDAAGFAVPAGRVLALNMDHPVHYAGRA